MEKEVLKHVCKFCSKSFSCGRSLGGHMRSHMINDITSQADGTTLTKKKLPSLVIINNTTEPAASNSYVLRENPKKTWRIPDQETSILDKSCKECGKVFQSWKALFGHIKSHSIEKEKFLIMEQQQQQQQQQEQEQEQEQEDSWTSVMDSQSDNETAAPNRKKRSQRRTRKIMGTTTNSSSSLCFANNNNNAAASSSVTEIEQEQEEVAICLMMLSRDIGGINSNSVAESSDNNFESRKTEKYPVSEFSRNLSKKKKSQSESQQDDESVVVENSGFELGKRRKLIESFDPERNSRFECATCNKIFHSYQALGGHRASHKKNKGCYGSSENSIEETVELSTDETTTTTKKSKLGHHACPICSKVFPSGQALGGHKRSHLVTTTNIEPKNNHNLGIQHPIPPPIRDFLDLNLPAPAEEESNGLLGFNQWWISRAPISMNL